MRVGKHLGRSERADQTGKMRTRSAYLRHGIFRLQDSQKASVENEKKASVELPLEKALRAYSNGSQAHLQPHYPERTGEVSCSTFQL